MDSAGKNLYTEGGKLGDGLFYYFLICDDSLDLAFEVERNRLKEAGAGTSTGMYRLLLCYILTIYDYAQMNQKYRYPVITAVKV